MPKHMATLSYERPKKRVRIQNQTAESIKSPSVPTKASPQKTVTISADKAIPKQDLKGKGRANCIDITPASFKVVAGSYEKLLYGLEGIISDDLKFSFKPLFIFPAHVSCIKAVAASPNGGKWLATGSSDEIIKIWDLRRKKEIGGLMHHEGSITHLDFPSRTHLLSASEDGTLCLFRSRDWVVLRSLKGHKGRINCVAVHPSGKLALSVGKDRTLRMWDLMRGKGSASTKLGKEGELVRWSSKGTLFAVQSGPGIDVYTTDMRLKYSINHQSRIHDIKFFKPLDEEDDLLLVAAEDKRVSIYSLVDDSPSIIGHLSGHSNRVKAVQAIDISLPLSSQRRSTTIICTTSSDGKIHAYDVGAVSLSSSSQTAPLEVEPAATYDSKGTRFTCLTVGDGGVAEESSSVKRKRDEEDENHDDYEDEDEEEEWETQQGDSDVEEELESENELELEED